MRVPEDSQQWPYDPPLSDAGLVAAEELGQKLQRSGCVDQLGGHQGLPMGCFFFLGGGIYRLFVLGGGNPLLVGASEVAEERCRWNPNPRSRDTTDRGSFHFSIPSWNPDLSRTPPTWGNRGRNTQVHFWGPLILRQPHLGVF